MANLGFIEPFDVTKKQGWREYKSRIASYLKCNKVADDLQLDTFISLIGADLYSLIVQLTQPAEVSGHSYAEIITLLDKHFDPKPSEIFQCYQFHTRVQQDGETVAAFAAALRGLSKDCGFDTLLDNMIRNQFVIGLKDKILQAKLLATANLTLATAISTAEATERSLQQAANLPHDKLGDQQNEAHRLLQTRHQPPNPGPQAQPNNSNRQSRSHNSSNFNRNNRNNQRNNNRRNSQSNNNTRTNNNPSNNNHRSTKCMRCGQSHMASECTHINSQCTYCFKMGHLYSVCRKRLREPNSQNKQSYPTKQLHEFASDNYTDVYSLFQTVAHTVPARILTNIKLNNFNINMEVDSACSLSIIDLSTFNRLNVQNSLSLQPSLRIITQFDGTALPLAGEVLVPVQYKDLPEQKLLLLVSRMPGSSLIGLNWFSPLGIQLTGVNKTVCKDEPTNIDLSNFSSLFSESTSGAIRTSPGCGGCLSIPGAARDD